MQIEVSSRITPPVTRVPIDLIIPEINHIESVVGKGDTPWITGKQTEACILNTLTRTRVTIDPIIPVINHIESVVRKGDTPRITDT